MKSRVNIKKLIIGAGNILLSDEGIGVHIVKELEKCASSQECPAGYKVDFFNNSSFVDIGTSSIDIGLYLSGNIKKMVIIDCIKAKNYEPGTVFKLDIDDLRKRQANSFSLHQMELVDSLKVLSITEPLPETLILGIVPAEIDVISLELSDILKVRLPVIISKVLKEIKEFFQADA